MSRFVIARFATFGGRPNSAGWYLLDTDTARAEGPFQTAALAEEARADLLLLEEVAA